MRFDVRACTRKIWRESTRLRSCRTFLLMPVTPSSSDICSSLLAGEVWRDRSRHRPRYVGPNGREHWHCTSLLDVSARAGQNSIRVLRAIGVFDDILAKSGEPERSTNYTFKFYSGMDGHELVYDVRRSHCRLKGVADLVAVSFRPSRRQFWRR